MELSKILLSILSFVMLFAFVAPEKSVYAEETEENLYYEFDETEALSAEADQYYNAIMELDEKLNMYNFSTHTTGQLSSLSPEAKEFYDVYKTTVAVEAPPTTGGDNNDVIKPPPISTFAIGYIGGVKNYYLTNQQVKDITYNVAIHGTGWGFITAIAKKFKRSPTFVTMLIIAVPALGAAALNKCNRLGRGIVIRDTRIGAMHSFTCFSR